MYVLGTNVVMGSWVQEKKNKFASPPAKDLTAHLFISLILPHNMHSSQICVLLTDKYI